MEPRSVMPRALNFGAMDEGAMTQFSLQAPDFSAGQFAWWSGQCAKVEEGHLMNLLQQSAAQEQSLQTALDIFRARQSDDTSLALTFAMQRASEADHVFLKFKEQLQESMDPAQRRSLDVEVRAMAIFIEEPPKYSCTITWWRLCRAATL